MAKGMYLGVSGKAQKVKKAYIGVDGKARKIKKMYIGDANGKARLFWSGRPNASMWFLASNERQYAQVSTDLSSWSKSANTFTSSRNGAFGDGKMYVLDFKTGGSNYKVHSIWASADGQTWTQQNAGVSTTTSVTLYYPSTAFVYLNKKLFWFTDAGGNTGVNYFRYSSDGGVTWTSVNKPSDKTNGHCPITIAYGLVAGYSSPKYFVYATSNIQGPYSDEIWVYDECFNYESTITIPNVDGVVVTRSISASVNILGVSNGSLKILLKANGYYRLAVYKNGTVTYKHKVATSATTGNSRIGGFVCTSEFTAWTNTETKKFYMYNDSTDAVTEKDISSHSGIAMDSSKACYDGERYIYAHHIYVYYTVDKGSTWTMVTTSGNGRTDIQCNIDGGGTYDPE